MSNPGDEKILGVSSCIFGIQSMDADDGKGMFWRFSKVEIFDVMAKHLGVRFVYEGESQPVAAELEAKKPGILTPEALSVLPVDEIRALYQAALRADQDLISDLLLQIEVEHADLASAQRNLVHGFRFDEIQRLTKL